MVLHISTIIMLKFQNWFVNNNSIFIILWDWLNFVNLVPYDGQCSVTCGEGQQTREVTCLGSRGERLADSACSGLAKPASVQVCRRPACHSYITWHVTDYGLVGNYRDYRWTDCLSTSFTLSCLVSAVHQKLRWWCEGEESGLLWYRSEPLPRRPVRSSQQTRRCGDMQLSAMPRSTMWDKSNTLLFHCLCLF